MFGKQKRWVWSILLKKPGCVAWVQKPRDSLASVSLSGRERQEGPARGGVSH
jgi:hypothetical protein